MWNCDDGTGMEAGMCISQYNSERFIVGKWRMSFAFSNELFVEKIKNACNVTAFEVS